MERKTAKELIHIEGWLDVHRDVVDWALVVANQNLLIHQYHEIDREFTWLTLSRDLPG